MKRTAITSSLVMTILGGTLMGCAEIERSNALATERDLAASGFQMKFAKTPTQIAKVGSLAQRKITRVTGPDDKPRFVWADAADCKCVYVGTEAAYDRFQKISVEQQIALENQMAAMDWNAWGPWGPWW